MEKDLYRKLSWIEEELLDEEYEEYEDYTDLTHLDVDDILEEFSQPEEKRRGKRNRAVYFDRAQYADEEFDESTAVLVERKRNKGKKGDPKPKNRRIRGLVILACLEIAGILGILWWWMRWLI